MQVWGIHNDTLTSELIDQGFVSIGWDMVGDLNEIPGGREEFKDELSRIIPKESVKSVPIWAGMLFRFRDEIQIGDVVVAPYKPDSTINIGVIAGDYEFEADALTHRHRRKVEWKRLGLARSSFTRAALGELSASLTLFRVQKNAQEFIAAMKGEQFVAERLGASSDWFPSADEYHSGLTVGDWVSLLQNPQVFTPSSLAIVKRFKDIGGHASCIHLAETYGKSAAFYNGGSSSLAERVAKATGCEQMPRDSVASRWWPILYTGRQATSQERGSYIWRLRDELSEALDQVDLEHIPLHEFSAEPIGFETYSKQEFLAEVFMSEPKYDQLVGLLRNKKNLILQGAPGVGKTFAAKRLAWSLMGEKDESRIEFVQFHQNYSYEDFMLGYKPSGAGFELKHGVFYKFCEQAAADPEREYFFIIDEINRGNMSKVFGELLMLIERDYRGTSATLAYNGEEFSVPANLYIIGMMNTADRSLAMIDYALRRRFSFFEVEPGFDTEGFGSYQQAFAHDLFDSLISHVSDLNKDIANDRSLGKGFCIGHSYVCGQSAVSEDWIRSVVEYDILPMLAEYWFDDESKLRGWESRLLGIFQ